MDNHPLLAFFKMVGDMVTKRSSVFNPLLKYNTIVISGSLVIYFRSDNLAVFIPSLVLMAYSIYRHEQFAKKEPHMLSDESIQKLGMEIAATPLGQKFECVFPLVLY